MLSEELDYLYLPRRLCSYHGQVLETAGESLFELNETLRVEESVRMFFPGHGCHSHYKLPNSCAASTI